MSLDLVLSKLFISHPTPKAAILKVSRSPENLLKTHILRPHPDLSNPRTLWTGDSDAAALGHCFPAGWKKEEGTKLTGLWTLHKCPKLSELLSSHLYSGNMEILPSLTCCEV